MGSGSEQTEAQQTEAQRAVQRARHAASQARIAAATRAYPDTLVRELFARPVRDCAYRCIGRPVNLLRAGRHTSLGELGLTQLREAGFEITVLTVDEDDPRWADRPAQTSTGYPRADQDHGGKVMLGDLRTIAIPPRSFDIVHCALLLDRIAYVELVLDRFTAALRPGGLFLLRIRDRDCAAGLLDRIAPQWFRQALWARLNPGQPGPFRAVYSPAASDRAILAYVQLRGLVLCQRETVRTWPAGLGRAAGSGGVFGVFGVVRVAAAARVLIARVTRERLTDAHDEVVYVIKKPQDRFAHVV